MKVEDFLSKLIEKKLLKEKDKDIIFEKSIQTDDSVLKILVVDKYIKEETLLDELSNFLGLPKIKISDYEIEEEVLKLFNHEICRENLIFPITKMDDTLFLAIFDPFSLKVINVIDEIKLKTKLTVEIFLTTISEILNAVRLYYKVTDELLATIHHATTYTLPEIEPLETEVKVEDIDAPIIKAVDLLLTQAINDRATDIHIDPDDEYVRIKFRIDGLLHQITLIPKSLQEPFISRIKIMAGMDIGEKRFPQDGYIFFNQGELNVNIRVATYPSTKGEKVHLRIFPSGKIIYHLSELGFRDDTLYKFENYIKRNYGLILITGPTGSGKTTTLYAVLDKLSEGERSIVTIEDPVEIRLPNIVQSQVNPDKNWDFKVALRSILRLDPDIIMVGEIRDLETARLSIQAALTGHLVFSTLHTKDSFSAPIRLIDMGVEPFLVSSSLLCVLSQRLVRLICPYCKKNYTPKKDLIEKLNIKKEKFYKGEGCKNCSYTGFLGRTGIFELMEINEEISKIIVEKPTPNQIKEVSKKYGTRTLLEEGINLIYEDKTTIEELIRIFGEV